MHFRMTEFLEKTSRQHQLNGLYSGSSYALQVDETVNLLHNGMISIIHINFQITGKHLL